MDRTRPIDSKVVIAVEHWKSFVTYLLADVKERWLAHVCPVVMVEVQNLGLHKRIIEDIILKLSRECE